MIVIDSRKMKYFNKKIIKIMFKMIYYMSYSEVYSLKKRANGEIILSLFEGHSVIIDKEDFDSYCEYLREELKIFNLKPEYRNDNIMDGYGWELEIKFKDGTQFESYGINKKPRKISKLIKSFKEIIFPQF